MAASDAFAATVGGLSNLSRAYNLAQLTPLQMQQMQLENAGLADTNRARRASLAGTNNLAAGLNMSVGELQAKLGIVPALGQLAQAKLANVEARSAAYNLEQAKRPLGDKLAEIFEGIGRLMGLTGGAVEQGVAFQQAAKNAVEATQGRRIAAFMQAFDKMDQEAAQKAGYPVDLFGNKDSLLAAKQVEDLISSGVDEEAALNQVLEAARQLALQKFQLLATPQGPETPRDVQQMNELRARSESRAPWFNPLHGFGVLLRAGSGTRDPELERLQAEALNAMSPSARERF